MSTTVIRIEADQFSETELDSMVKVLQGLSLDSPFRKLLQGAIDAGHRGAGFTALAQDGDLTPNEAAKALGMSRPHLLKFIRKGILKARYVGSHQRIAYSDFMDFKARHEDASKDAATALAGKNGLGKQIELTDEEMAELDSF